MLSSLDEINNHVTIFFSVIKGLGRFPKIPENTFIPVHEHVMRPRTRSCVTMWSLPEELILHQLKWLHVRDLLNMRRVSKHVMMHMKRGVDLYLIAV